MTESEFTKLYKEYRSYIGKLISDSVFDESERPDVNQEVWLKVWKSKDTYKPAESHIKTWLTHVTRSVCKRYLNKNYSKQPELITDSALAIAQSEDSEDESVKGSWIEQMVPSQQTAEDDQILHELIMRGATLSEQENAVFNLVYWHGQSYAAVAKKLGVTVEHVGVVCNHLRDKLEVKDLYHSAYTYHAPGAVWGDWSWKGQNSPWVSRPDLVAAYNGEVQ